jgi:hypothetical protein
MAGIQALVNQKQAARQGNPAPHYYKLAALSGASCVSADGDASGCVFHNVTTGSIDVDCTGSTECYGAISASSPQSLFGNRPGFGQNNSNSYTGILSKSSSSLSAAYAAGSGWNFASGLGSVNAYNLVMKWNSVP